MVRIYGVGKKRYISFDSKKGIIEAELTKEDYQQWYEGNKEQRNIIASKYIILAKKKPSRNSGLTAYLNRNGRIWD